jgi:hypothetical protein
MAEQQENCTQTPDCTQKPAVEPRRGQLIEELRFLKKQQWAVTIAVVTLLGGVVALTHYAEKDL